MIAWYVHHHGQGHTHRALAVAADLARRDLAVVGLSSAPAPPGWPGPWVRLPLDVGDGPEGDATAGGTLHWAPLGHPGLRARMAAISAVLASGEVRLLVADVSVEVAALARLHGVAVAVVAQPGDRTDRPHALAYDQAALLLAPWPARPPRPWPEAWAAKAVHLGGLSRYDGREREAHPTPGSPRVLVLWGSGGVDVTADQLTQAAAATPGWTWEVAGAAPASPVPASAAEAASSSSAVEAGSSSSSSSASASSAGVGSSGGVWSSAGAGAAPGDVRWLGWVGDVWERLCRADVVVTHAGQNAVAEVAAARRPAVVVAQERPFGEQHATAGALSRAGLAVVPPRWPAAGEWPAVLARARAGGGDGWAAWSDGGGARRAAEAIAALVG